MNGNVPFPAIEMQIVLSNCDCVGLLTHQPIYVVFLYWNEPGCLLTLQMQKAAALKVTWWWGYDLQSRPPSNLLTKTENYQNNCVELRAVEQETELHTCFSESPYPNALCQKCYFSSNVILFFFSWRRSHLYETNSQLIQFFKNCVGTLVVPHLHSP